MIYPNLEAEMRRLRVTQQDIAAYIGRRPETVSKWMNGRSGEFSIGMAMAVKRHFFPSCSVEYLFSHEPCPPTVSSSADAPAFAAGRADQRAGEKGEVPAPDGRQA